MADLLVSVRNAQEAAAALVGGAALIDIKEPTRGPLGRADDAVMAAIVDAVAGSRPVSAALGELVDAADLPAVKNLSFVKWGLAQSASRDWRGHLSHALDQPGPQVVIAAYADWQCAAAPPLDEVVAFACQRPSGVLLIDTHCKDAARLSLRRRPTLLDWLRPAEVDAICRRCADAKIRVALAGSLGPVEIALLLPARPTWFAVRGAVCADSDRQADIESKKVRDLATLVKSTATRGN